VPGYNSISEWAMQVHVVLGGSMLYEGVDLNE